MSSSLCHNGVGRKEAYIGTPERKYSCWLDSFIPRGTVIARCAITSSADNMFSLTTSHFSRWYFVNP